MLKQRMNNINNELWTLAKLEGEKTIEDKHKIRKLVQTINDNEEYE
jgi:hypothetical protein